MTFDYFNTSHLGFGSKITKAFLQLNKLLEEGEDNIQDLMALYELYSQYIDQNYPAPFPTRPDAPVRCKELFDILNDGNTLRAIWYDQEEEKLHVTITLFKRISSRFTVGTGETDLKKGYAFCRDSVSNKQFTRDVQFVENYEDGKGNFLFEFRIDEDNNINIVGDSYKYYIPSSFDHINSMVKGDNILTNTKLSGSTTYTAEDYECVVVVGYLWPNEDPNPGSEQSLLEVSVNGKTIADIRGRFCRQSIVVYLKPGDVLKASCRTAFRVNYISGEPVPPQPDPPGPPIPPEPAIEMVKQRNTHAFYRYYGNQWHFEGPWTYESFDEEVDFTGSTERSDIYPSLGTAVGCLFTLDNAVPDSTSYTLSFDFRGVQATPFYSPDVTDKCRVEFLNSASETISVQDLTVAYPESGSSDSFTRLTVEDMQVPTATKFIRIASMGFSYNSAQQRYYSHCGLNNVSFDKVEEEEQED